VLRGREYAKIKANNGTVAILSPKASVIRSMLLTSCFLGNNAAVSAYPGLNITIMMLSICRKTLTLLYGRKINAITTNVDSRTAARSTFELNILAFLSFCELSLLDVSSLIGDYLLISIT
jgi:hypothetical protein